MAKGNKIVVTADPKGIFEWFHLAGAYNPGSILQVDASVALKGGKHTAKAYSPGADGENPLGGYWVLCEDQYQGRPPTEAYGSGEFAKAYSPRMGEHLNLLLADVAGTADDHPLNEKLMVDNGTGKLIATTGSPEDEVAQLLEAVTDPTGDTLAWCQWAK